MKKSLLFLLIAVCSGCCGSWQDKAGEPGEKTEMAPREAYEGFEWREIAGAGLELRVQTNGNIRLLPDPSLPGIVVVRDEDRAPHPVIRIFDLPEGNIGEIIPALEKTGEWDPEQNGRFIEIKSAGNGVKRFVLVPKGKYAREIRKQMKSGPVPSTCNGWGIGNSGTRYFEIHENRPDKAVFIEIGQDAPLFDESSIRFSNSGETCTAQDRELFSKDRLYTMKGIVRIGHEVRTFVPEGCNEEFWIADRTGILNETYDKVTGGMKNGKEASAELKLEYDGKWDDGFAAEYPGVFLVREVISIKGCAGQ